MNGYVYVATLLDHFDGCPFNDPYGPSDNVLIIGVYSSEELAKTACVEYTKKYMENNYPEAKIIEETNRSITFDTDDGYVAGSWKEYQLDKTVG